MAEILQISTLVSYRDHSTTFGWITEKIIVNTFFLYSVRNCPSSQMMLNNTEKFVKIKKKSTFSLEKTKDLWKSETTIKRIYKKIC